MVGGEKIMILADNDIITDYASKGLWGSESADSSLAGLLEKRARELPNALAVCDDPSLSKWTHRKSRKLT